MTLIMRVGGGVEAFIPPLSQLYKYWGEGTFIHPYQKFQIKYDWSKYITVNFNLRFQINRKILSS